MGVQFGNYLPKKFHGECAEELPPAKVAVVGTGVWGYEHARAFNANPYTQLLAICGRNKERAQKRAGEFGVKAYTSVEQMIDAERPDLVSLSLPDLTHYETTLRVLKAGVSALVEKPFVFDLAEARSLLEEAKSRDLFFAINFNHRYSEPFLRAKRLIDESKVGEITFASWRFGGNHDYTFDHPHAHLIETECHGIDALLHLVGPIESVSAQMTDKTGKKGYTTIVVALKFANGAVGSLVGSYDTSYAYPGAHVCEVNGTRGRVLVEDTVKKLTFNRIDDPVSQVWQSGYFDDEARYFAGTHDRHVADLVRCFRQGMPPPIPAQRGYEVLRVCHAAIRAFEERRTVAVDEVY
ncbi:MAG: Gfo/Idh/MocA family oxidoreductase [Planctomycetes bacterium]|nr:Gfo/Idh/MocA family oxidoreductase [Planctomycetota bacterium]